MDFFISKKSYDNSKFIDLLSDNRSYLIERKDYKRTIHIRNLLVKINHQISISQQLSDDANEMCYDLYTEILEQAFQQYNSKYSNKKIVKSLTVMKPVRINSFTLQNISGYSLNNTVNQQEVYKTKLDNVDRKYFNRSITMLTSNQRKFTESIYEIVEFNDIENMISKK